MTKTAHIFKNAKGYELIIAFGPSIRDEFVIRRGQVAGKREARAIAAEYRAQPHNF